MADILATARVKYVVTAHYPRSIAAYVKPIQIVKITKNNYLIT